MATYTVSSGHTARNQLNYGDVEYVLSGGKTQDQYNYGQRFVSSGGVVRNGVVSSGGKDYLQAGASSYQGVISGGGIRYVSSGAVANNTYVRTGGTVSAYSGALASNTLVFPGGNLNAAGGAVVDGATISSGSLNAAAGAIFNGLISATSNSIIRGGQVQSGATVDISYYTSVTSDTVNSGGSLIMRGSTSGSNVTLNGGSITMNGALLSGITFTGSNGIINLNNASANGIVQTSNGTPLTNGNTININSGGVVTGQTIGSGGLINVYKGFTSNAVLDGGTMYVGVTSGTRNTTFTSNGGRVELGGTYNDTRPWTVSNNVIFIVSSGATMNSSTINSGGIVEEVGGIVSTTTVNGGTLILNTASASRNTSFTSNGGTVRLNSGYSNGTIPWAISRNVSFFVSSGATLNGVTVSSGGALFVSSGGVIGNTTTVSSGGTMVMHGTAGSGTINLAGDGSKLIISGTEMPTNVISGWSSTDQIDLASIPQSSITKVDRSTNQVVITTREGQQYKLNVPNNTAIGYRLQDDGNGGTVYTTCFAGGTLIATPSGQVPVEDLAEGDMVSTPKGAMPVKWTGYRSITVADQRVPEENWLVRIRANAFEDGVPVRDLLVTQEHCMVFDGRMIPARMLVNGASVLLDRTIGAYTYYHLELEAHEAVWAEGALTESYLDTGNRDQFENHDVTALFPSRRAVGSVGLPLDTSRAFVEPIYHAILARAGGVMPVSGEMTEDADLRLIVGDRLTLRPCRVNGNNHIFIVPAGVKELVIASRTARPSDVVGPFVDDRRDLGVLVGQVSLFEAGGKWVVDQHLSDAGLSGWSVVEDAPMRWTLGAATLPLSAPLTEACVLSLEVISQGPYFLETKHSAVA